MARFSLLPRRELWSPIDRLWGWLDEPELPPLFPGTGAELFFYPGGQDISDETGVALPSVHLTCPRQRQRRLKNQGPVSFIAVRFRSSALRHFVPMPVHEVADQILSAPEIWGREGRQLTSQLAGLEAGEAALEVVQRFLIQVGERYQKKDPWDRVIDDLYYAAPDFSMARYCQERQVGIRQLERNILAAVGVSPKSFQRTARIQRVVKRLLISGRSHYLEEALDAGYYDQSHFLHDFKKFTGESPVTFFHAQRFKTHFYNTSRPARG